MRVETARRTNVAIWLEKYKRWQIKVQKNGERKTFTSSIPGKAGQRECHCKADAWLDDRIVSDRTSAYKLFDEYIKGLKDAISFDHWSQYEGYGNNWI